MITKVAVRFITLVLLFLGASRAISGHAQTAWNDGFPRQGLKNADNLMEEFKTKAKHLAPNGKLRVLIIGDSLSDGYYHWSHYFRKNLQAAY